MTDMKTISDAWTLYRDMVLARFPGDARARAEIERAFFAGAEYIVDEVMDTNDAGLMLPLQLSRQLQLWEREVTTHIVSPGVNANG